MEEVKLEIDELGRMHFGRAARRMSRQIEQLELRLEELESGAAEASAKADAGDAAAAKPERASPRIKSGGKRKPLPDHLPPQQVLHQAAGDGACICPACGGGMGALG